METSQEMRLVAIYRLAVEGSVMNLYAIHFYLF